MIDSLFAGNAPPLLVEQAHRLAAALGAPRGRIVLSCQYADGFVPGLLGAWLAGATVELLPNVQPATLDRVDADPEIDRVLHDGAAHQGRSAKALYVPDVIQQPTSARATGWPTIAAMMSTSGTTAQPRYVVKKMAQLVDEIDVLATVIPPARTVLATVPLSHLYGMLWGVLLPLRFGARIVSHGALLPGELAAVIEREGVDLMISTPAHLRAMANVAMPRGLRVISSGARMPPELHMSLATGHGWHVTEVLGSTETGGIATRTQPLDSLTPLPRVTVTAPGGRLVVESPWSGERRAVLDDLVELDDRGGFRHVGRSSELIKIAGKRAHAQAIEAAIPDGAGHRRRRGDHPGHRRERAASRGRDRDRAGRVATARCDHRRDSRAVRRGVRAQDHQDRRVDPADRTRQARLRRAPRSDRHHAPRADLRHPVSPDRAGLVRR